MRKENIVYRDKGMVRWFRKHRGRLKSLLNNELNEEKGKSGMLYLVGKAEGGGSIESEGESRVI